MVFDRIVEETGGTRIAASPAAYEELLNHLRGFYVVGYYVPRPDPTAAAEIQQHAVRVELPERDADVLYPRLDYRPTIDRLRVESELDEARRQLQGGDAQGALFAAANALAADPSWGPSYVARAEIFEDLGRLDEAAADALTAADLAPGDAATHRLAARLAAWVGDTDNAWEQGIRAAQAGVTMDALFDSLALATAPPADLAERLAAPRLGLVVGPSRKNDVFARAALGKAMLAVGRALEAVPLLGLSRSPEDADFIVRVSDESIDEQPPRRFRGRITVTSAAGDEIYDEGFTLDDLDDRARNAEDLAEKVSEIAAKIARQNR
jgi:tetratricopeptide (TPR) repeat protein